MNKDESTKQYSDMLIKSALSDYQKEENIKIQKEIKEFEDNDMFSYTAERREKIEKSITKAKYRELADKCLETIIRFGKAAAMLAGIFLIMGIIAFSISENARKTILSVLIGENVGFIDYVGTNESEEEIENIIERYSLKYIPEGYKMTGQDEKGDVQYKEYFNGQDDYIIFWVLDNGSSVNIKEEYYGVEEINIDNKMVYMYVDDNNSYIYASWKDGEYTLEIKSHGISEEEIKKVIEKIENK